MAEPSNIIPFPLRQPQIAAAAIEPVPPGARVVVGYFPRDNSEGVFGVWISWSMSYSINSDEHRRVGEYVTKAEACSVARVVADQHGGLKVSYSFALEPGQ